MRINVYNSKRNRKEIRHLLKRRQINGDDKTGAVSIIVKTVRKRGDRALFYYSKVFDGIKINAGNIKVKQKEINTAYRNEDAEFLKSAKTAISNIEKFQKHFLIKSRLIEGEEGGITGQIISPIESVGIYVPGGRAVLPSSLVMACVPARVAGVKRIAIVSPPQKDGNVGNSILATAKLLGITEIYKVGGAQAISALAYGTESIPKVDKIVGPGNAYVTEAKRHVFGIVDIDNIAGPSEILIIADRTANPAFIASDILAQCEHDVDAVSILLTDSIKILGDVKAQIAKQSAVLSRKNIIQASLSGSAFILVGNINEAVNMANEFAPEHVEIMTKNADRTASGIKNAGAIFIGEYSPVAAGDYCAGTNHILPTSGSAKFMSPLGVEDFLKKTSVIKLNKTTFIKLSNCVKILAGKEGLDGHVNSIQIRA